MTILNPDNIYYISKLNGLKSKEIRYTYDPVLWPVYHDDEKIQCCIIEFFQGDEFDDYELEELIEKDLITRIKNKEVFLIVHNSHESFHWVVDPIYKNLVIRNNIPAEQIILLSESADISKEIHKVSLKLNLPEIKHKWINKFQHDVHHDNHYMLRQGKVRQPLENKKYVKKFLNLNRRWRNHRPTLVAALWDKKLLESGFVSLSKSDDDKSWPQVLSTFQNLYKNNQYLYNLFTSRKSELENFPELKLDDVDLMQNQPELTPSLDYFYENSYFSIISETCFFTEYDGHAGRFMTEKTFKPMAYYHPFIIVSVPLMLEKLQEIGYKTFHPYINEDYDKEKNDADRLLKIVDEVERLCNLNEIELADFIKNVNPICQHNYNLLMSRTKFIF